MKRARGGARGTATVETVWVIAIFAIPTLLLLSALGVAAFADYKSARNTMLQAYP